MRAPVECPFCGRLYRADKISRCPGCVNQAVENPSTPSTTNSGPQPFNYKQESVDLFDLLKSMNQSLKEIRRSLMFIGLSLGLLVLGSLILSISA